MVAGFILLSTVATGQPVQGEGRVSCDAMHVLRNVRLHGAKAVVRKIWDTPTWACVVGNISTGESHWISVAIALAPGTDAGSSEELSDSLFLALARNPTELLVRLPREQRANGVPSLASVCEGRTDPPESYEVAIHEYQAARNAVSLVDSPEVAAARLRCLTELEAGQAAIRHFYEASQPNPGS